MRHDLCDNVSIVFIVRYYPIFHDYRSYRKNANYLYKNNIRPCLPSRAEIFYCQDANSYMLTFCLNKFDRVKPWKCCVVRYEPLIQHYGLETGWPDITTDFNVALFFAVSYYDRDEIAKNNATDKEANGSL